MYELILASNNYGLVASDEENGIKIDPVLLDDSLLSYTNLLNDNNEDEINVFDIKFMPKVKKADKLDYLAATFSGALSCGIHRYINRHTRIDVDFDNLKIKDVGHLSSILLKHYGYSKDAVCGAEEKINEIINSGASKIQRATNYKKLVVDFARGLSYKALLMSIFTSVLDIEIGKDETGQLVINKIEDKNQIGKTIYKKIQIGFVKWLISNTVEYRNTGEFKEEADDVFKIIGGLKKLKDIIKELADTKFFKNKDLNEIKLSEYVISEINKTKETDEEKQYNFDGFVKKQTIPVIFNKAFVRTYFFIKTFISQVNEHQTKTLEGLEVLELAKIYKNSGNIITRMDTVSSAVFMALDVIPAVGVSVKAGYNTFKTNYVPSQDEKIAMINAITAATKALKQGVNVFASTVNFANIGEFVTVIKVDKDYLIEDIKELFNKTKTVEIKKKEFTKLSDEQISSVLGLNKIETRILYSIELDIVKTDIQNTKNSKIQIKKNKWKKQWTSECSNALKIKKLFEEDREKLYSLIETHKYTDDLWLYKLIIELMSFKPYCQLDDDEEKYKGLKLSYSNYIEEVMCEQQKVLNYKEFEKLANIKKKNVDLLSGNAAKTAAMIAGAAVITVGTAGAAFAFAPAIAVGLVGGSFAGLSGAALTSASLALVGGGAIAAGGLGMAGGTAIIAGGGALLGLGASGATATVFAMMSTSSFVLEDNSKLLTKCSVLLDKYNMVNEVLNIQNQLTEELENAKVKLDVLENTIEIDKENKKERESLIKEQEKSIEIMEKADKALTKMIDTYNKKMQSE